MKQFVMAKQTKWHCKWDRRQGESLEGWAMTGPVLSKEAEIQMRSPVNSLSWVDDQQEPCFEYEVTYNKDLRKRGA